MKQSSFITLQPAVGQENALVDFLKMGAGIVQSTEPETLLWTALQSSDSGHCAIFDTFGSEAGRDAHFAGDVAAALNANAPTLVQGGWDDGVIPNIQNGSIVGSKVSASAADVKIATWIPFTAKPGMAPAVAELLAAGANIVAETEPQTLYWFGIQLDENRFAILDFFADQAGIDAHFAGDVAAALHANAEAAVEGGWEDGVVAGIQRFDVVTFLAR